MKTFILFFLVAGSSLFGGQKEKLMALLTSNPQKSAFLSGLTEFKLAEVPDLEARFFFGMKTRDWPFLYELIPTYDNVVDKGIKGLLLMDEREFVALGLCIKAKKALDEGDDASFEIYAKQAFWEDPRIADLLEKWITQHRQAQLRVPLDVELLDLDGTKITLQKLMEGRKAVILDFWASWCGPCIGTFPELPAHAAAVDKKGVVWVGLNTESNIKIANKFAKQHNITSPWLAEPSNRPYSKLLKVDSIPRTVMITPDGKIVFNGHPQDPSLDQAVDRLISSDKK